MVTIVRGTKRSHNEALKVAASIAAMSAYDLHRKTLILQVANNLSDISYELAGKQTLDSPSYGFENNTDELGIDALLARAATGMITEKQFEALVEPISKEKHELDVAAKSNTDNNIEYTVYENIQDFRQLLESAAGDTEADAPYDNVIVVANGKKNDLLELIRPLADNEVICVGQNASEMQDNEADDSGIKKVIIVNDFSEESVYNLRYMKKEYKKLTQNVYALPHNILLSDAAKSGRIAAFITENLQVDISNVNFAVIDSLRQINNLLFKEKSEDRSDMLKGLKSLSEKKEKNERVKFYPLPEGSVTINETEIKKLFRKPYTERTIELDTENTVETADEIEYEDFGVSEQFLEDLEYDKKRIKKEEKKSAKKNKAAQKDGEDMDKETKAYLKKQQQEMEKEKKAKKKKGGLFGLFGKSAEEKIEEDLFEQEEPVETDEEEEPEEFDGEETYIDEKAESDAYERDIDPSEYEPEENSETYAGEVIYEEEEPQDNGEEIYEEPAPEDDYIPKGMKENDDTPENTGEDIRKAKAVEVENDFEIPRYETAQDGEFRADDLLDAMLNRR
ncbi:MAG: hypothetical protein IKS09_03150 [Lachnospiraceae bacterium]|nr:hypothetical protein [Lachnospiraceae bacterium]